MDQPPSIKFDLADFLATPNREADVCALLVAIAAQDGPITVPEYEILTQIAASVGGEIQPLLAATLICHFCLNPPDLADILARLKGYDLGEAFLADLGPLLALQGKDRDALARRVQTGLGQRKIAKFLDVFRPEKSSQSVDLAALGEKYALPSLQWVTKGDLRMEVRAQATRDIAYMKQAIRAGFDDASIRQSTLQTVLNDQAEHLSRMLLQETARRLLVIEERLTLEHQLFCDDLDLFLQNAKMAFRDSAHTALAERATWDSFRETSGGAAVAAQYAQVRNRYQRLNQMWERELEVFTQELTQLKNVLKDHRSEDFGKLIPPQSLLSRGLDTIEAGAEGILRWAGLGLGALGVTAAFPGAGVVIVGTLSSLAPTVTLPVAGAVAMAALFKKFVPSDKRRAKELTQQAQGLEMQLIQMIEDAKAEHLDQTKAVMAQFQDYAMETLRPVAITYETSRYLRHTIPQVLTMVSENSVAELERAERQVG